MNIERRETMKFINTRRFSWVILGIGVVLTIAAFFSLPEIIPMHFTRGVADDFSSKREIFFFPGLQLVIMVLSGNKNIKYLLTHSRRTLNDVQYNWIINGLCIFILIVECYVIFRAFH